MSTILTNVIDAIISGAVDDQLDDVIAAVNDRRDMKARTLFHTVAVGSRATLKNLRPKYMVGVPVIITKKNNTRIECKIDPEYLAANRHQTGRFDARPFTVTPNMLDPIA